MIYSSCKLHGSVWRGTARLVGAYLTRKLSRLLNRPTKVARSMGNISRLVLVKNISNLIQLIDPLTGQTATMESDVFWRDPFRPLITAARSRLTRYVVLGKEAVFLRRNVSKKTVNRKQKTRLASLTLAREEDLGINDSQFEERSHVGYLMKAGDVSLGYDLRESQFVDDEAENQRALGDLPDVVMVRKLYGGAALATTETKQTRVWRLRRLDVVTPTEAEPRRKKAVAEAEDADAMDEEDFLQEVEADKEMRHNINLYRNEVVRKKRSGSMDTERSREEDPPQTEAADDEQEDDQKVTLEELLDGLNLDEGRDAEEEQEVGLVETYGEGEKAAKDGIAYIAREDARAVREKDTAVNVANGAMGDDFFGKLMKDD
jgi:nonsense-mediated mRNA decay protein 3